MSKIKDLPNELPDSKGMFQLDIVGTFTKRRFLGEFYCKIPTLRDQSLIAVYESALNGEFPVYLNPGVQKLHKWISYLKFTLTDTPKFWRDANYGFDLNDPNVVEAVYDSVLKFEQEWYEKVWGTEGDDLEIEPKVKDEANDSKKDQA